MRPSRALPHFAIVSILALASPFVLRGQASPQASQAPAATPRLITEPVDETKLTAIIGSTHPLARAEFDQGVAPGSLPTNRILLVLKRSPEQEATLERFLEDQQSPASPNFHKWLTPAQFGQQFGPADDDLQTVTSWLGSHGFTVARVANGRTVVEFSGTVAQVTEAFHTEIHRYVVNGEEHWANSTDPKIPTALTPLVAGTLTLHNFPRTPMYHLAGIYSREKATGKIHAVNPATPSPLITFPGGCDPDNNCYAVGPADFATIYNVLPLWNSGIDGTGQTIAIVGESNINIQDVRDFRSFFGLPAKDPQIILDGPDPGLQPDETEADLDVELSGGVAKAATIKLVLDATTATTLGVDLSAEYIVDNNLAPILSESYGVCELFIGTAGNQFYNQLWQQAAAEGITAFLASGDQGSAVCDRQFQPSPQPAQFGLQVSGFSSTPYNVSVGGTDFNDPFNPTTFWNVTNGAGSQVSAKGYIPEITWNDTCTNSLLKQVGFTGTPEQNCNNPQLAAFVNATGGSGGKSSCTVSDGLNPLSCSGGYAKPSWQTGPGVPNDGKRDVPDVSLFSSNGFDGNFYGICESDFVPGATSCDPTAALSEFVGIGGTSASSPAFAAIIALVEQQTGARQGNANYVLYKLAAQNSCPSNASPAATCVFYDVTGGTIAVPCARGTPDCTTTSANDQFGVLNGYSAGPGYDQATGLGSVNAANLVKAWTNVSLAGKPTTTTLAVTTGTPPQAAPFTITHGTPVNVSATVASTQAGAGTPTGNVALIAATGSTGEESVAAFALAGSAPATATGATQLLPGGNYALTSHYPGDATFAASDSTPVSVTVTPEASQTQVALTSFDPITGAITGTNLTTVPFGSPYFLDIAVRGKSGATCKQNPIGVGVGGFPVPANAQPGCPTGTLTLTDNGSPLDGSPAGSGNFALNGAGIAEDRAIQLLAGQHNLAAAYPGDASFMAQSSAALMTVSKASTSIAINGPISIQPPFNLIYNLTTSSNAQNILPSGTATLLDGTTPIQSMPVMGSFNIGVGTASAFGIFPVTSIQPGAHNFSVQYSGDSNYASSTSQPFQVKVLYGTTTSVTTSSPMVQVNQSVTLTAQVIGTPSGGPPITGSVEFLLAGAPLGTANVMNGQAQLTAKPTFAGNGLTGLYEGDANYDISSGFVSLQVTQGPDFTLSVAGTVTISAPGGSGMTMITVAALSGFTGTVAFACSGLPSESTCNASSVNGSGTTTLTVMTTAPSMMAPRTHPNRIGGPAAPRQLLLIPLCILVLTLLTRRREQRWITALALLVFASMAMIAACGGGGGGGGVRNPGTPTGTTTAMVTGTGTVNGSVVTHAIPVTINVQ